MATIEKGQQQSYDFYHQYQRSAIGKKYPDVSFERNIIHVR